MELGFILYYLYELLHCSDFSENFHFSVDK